MHTTVRADDIADLADLQTERVDVCFGDEDQRNAFLASAMREIGKACGK
jgi:hypothetical protein